VTDNFSKQVRDFVTKELFASAIPESTKNANKSAIKDYFYGQEVPEDVERLTEWLVEEIKTSEKFEKFKSIFTTSSTAPSSQNSRGSLSQRIHDFFKKKNDADNTQLEWDAGLKLGQAFRKRRKDLGRRLNWWYGGSASLFVATLLVCWHYSSWVFNQSAIALNESFVTLTGNGASLTNNQVLGLYYSGKIGLIALLFVPLIWMLKRLTRLQTDRRDMAQKEALAFTLELCTSFENPELKKEILRAFAPTLETNEIASQNNTPETAESLKILADFTSVVKKALSLQ
jgi:hypothetical protein